MSGRKPDFSVSIKPAGEGQRVSLGAWWREDGKLKGGWDKRVKRVYVLLDDGKGGEVRVDVKKDERWSHYLNIWEEEQKSEVKRPAPAEDSFDDPGSDDIPF